MKNFAMTYTTVSGLINNEAVRAISPTINAAYDGVNAPVDGKACSSCTKRKRINDAATRLITELQSASDLELDRIKKALGVDKLIFPNGMTFTER